MYKLIEQKITEEQNKETGEWYIEKDDVVSPLPEFTDKDKAESAWYLTMAYAKDPNLSKVDIHAVTLLDHTGAVILNDCCYHRQPRENEGNSGAE